MPFPLQLMMGVSLAACAGLRAWLPLLVVGLLARNGILPLNPSFAILVRTDVLVVLAIAALLEFLGDKVIALDHVLDMVGTVARPVAGSVLASSMLTRTDPAFAMMLTVVAGGATSLTIHSGKAVVRAKSSILAPFHAGVGNAGLSSAEDVATVGGLWLALHSPILAFALTVLALVIAALLVIAFVRTGAKLFAFVKRKRGAQCATL